MPFKYRTFWMNEIRRQQSNRAKYTRLCKLHYKKISWNFRDFDYYLFHCMDLTALFSPLSCSSVCCVCCSAEKHLRIMNTPRLENKKQKNGKKLIAISLRSPHREMAETTENQQCIFRWEFAVFFLVVYSCLAGWIIKAWVNLISWFAEEITQANRFFC